MTTTTGNPDCALPTDCRSLDGRREIQRLATRGSDVGGIPVARALPQKARRLVGAWCFLDHIGPTRLEPGMPRLKVGPHPHTSLQTFTWMMEGEILHRDSLGIEQPIRPGQVNLMTAGHGISHTEESIGDAERLHAAQLWIALPREHRDTTPRFDHYAELPEFGLGALTATLLVGHHGGHQAPTLSFSPLMGMDLAWRRRSRETLALDPAFEYGLLPLEGDAAVDGERFTVGEFAYLGRGHDALALDVEGEGRALLVGGVPLEGEIILWWNFVGHDRTEMEQALRQWEAGDPRFGDIPNPVGPRLVAPPPPWASQA